MHNNNNNNIQLIQNVDTTTPILVTAILHSELYFWSATIFKSDKKQEHKTNACPVCFNDSSISLIPLTKDEVY
jgi:hypothetical protein